jgi:hypothetical protein
MIAVYMEYELNCPVCTSHKQWPFRLNFLSNY